MNQADIVVVGAGWAGLSAASRLSASGFRVLVVEKGRGAGGRSATRRQDSFQFDHGAQYFTARSDAFSRQVSQWQQRGLIAAWSPRLTVFGPRPDTTGKTPNARWIGVPGMNAVLADLAGNLDCRFAQRVERIDYTAQWRLILAGGEELDAKALILTAPPAQSSALLGGEHPLSSELDVVPMGPTWALMAGFATDPAPGFDAAFDNEGPLSWMACNSSKAGRSGSAAWVAHASVEWSREHLERDSEWVADQLYAALCRRLDSEAVKPALLTAHRWRYAQCQARIETGCLWHGEENLAVAGDWAAGNRIEGAWISGQAAAQRIEEQFSA